MPMIIDVEPGRRLRYRLSGALAEPRSARWRSATEAERLRYWPILADVLLANWRAQMLAGLGRRGRVRRARAISRLAYAQRGLESTGPGLLPQRDRSRAYRLARVTPYADLGRVTGYWAASFGRILSYHHTGTAGRGRPWFDDAGRIRWRGLPGETTGIHRDLLPTLETISASVIEAGSRWARLVGPGPGPDLDASFVVLADRPAGLPADAPPAFPILPPAARPSRAGRVLSRLRRLFGLRP